MALIAGGGAPAAAHPLALAIAQLTPPAPRQAEAPLPAPPPPAIVAAPTPPIAAPAAVPELARARHAPGDPWEGFNRRMFKLQQSFDKAFFRPVALGYKTVVPRPVRTGLRHFISNLTEPIVFLNDLLQLRPGRAARTFARFFINSTAGVGGLLDVAKTAKLPHRDNGLGNTLARYGVGPGPYVFLPFFGPNTLRDLIGGQADNFVLPVAVGNPFDRFEFQLPLDVVNGLDQRAENDVALRAILDSAADPYASLRSVFLQNRTAEVAAVKGEAPAQSPLLDDPLTDPEAAPGDTPPAPDSGTPPADVAAPPAEPAPAPPPAAEPAPAPAPGLLAA